MFFLGLRLFFAVVVVLRVIARHCIAFGHASDAGWGVSYWQCVVRVRADYVFYTYLTPTMRDEVHVPEQYLSVGLVIFGVACLWSNLYGGKLADRGRGVEPLTHIRPIYSRS